MPAGRPPMFKTNEELEEKIELYFNPTLEKDEKPRPYSITGLALHLGFHSRTSMYDYEGKKEFMYTIKKARTVIEQYYEENLLSRNATGAIFALKNFGWKDKVYQENDGTLNINISRTIIGGSKT